MPLRDAFLRVASALCLFALYLSAGYLSYSGFFSISFFYRGLLLPALTRYILS